MVTTVTPYTDVRSRALIGDGFDGVVRVVVGYTIFSTHPTLTSAMPSSMSAFKAAMLDCWTD